ncbi:LysM peptidoglycan-binding domain-containing protein [Micromonospora sp. CPCC 205711]|uniref:LysM peptidoglycan-binding domain-containing protein n=1 Tax=Micromonospora sp. CPCC 205547 TaxID=3122400 RepID=UPI002FF18F17
MTAPRGSAVRRTGQLLTGFGSLVVLVALLAGAPVALLAFAGNPLPDHLPSLAAVGTALTSRDDGQLFLRALAVVGWFGWATFAFSVLVELGAQVARRPAPRLPGMSRQQRAAAALVGSVALIIAASPAASAATALSYPSAAPAATALAAPATTTLAPRTAAAPGGGQPAVYQVAQGDYLGEVAERYLDDFDRYPEVARLNRLPDADRIHPGQLIKLPAGADDTGTRRHAAGHLVTPRKPAPHPPATSPTAPKPTGPQSPTGPQIPTGPQAPTGQPGPGGQAGPGGQPGPGGQAGPQRSAGAVTPAPGTRTPHGKVGPSTPQTARPQTAQPPVEKPAGAPPAMAAGASRATEDDRMNRPLAVSAVLAVASIIGAQIGAVLGLRRRPARVTAGRTSAARTLAARTSTARTSAGRAAASRASAARALVSGRHRRD